MTNARFIKKPIKRKPMRETWADERWEELMKKGEENWDEDDWEAYDYIRAVRAVDDYESEYALNFLVIEKYPNHKYAKRQKRHMRESYEDFVIEDGVLVKYNGNDTDIVIPDEVTEIGKKAFFQNNDIRTVKMPNVLSIGRSAFIACENLITVEMPSVETIDYMAFWKCTSLVELVLPNVRYIDADAFSSCTSLTDISINPTAEVDRYAFDGTPIEDEIKERFGLTERMSRKQKKPIRESVDGDFYIVDGGLREYLGQETDVVIPDEVERIEMGAFEHNERIVSVKGNSVKSIGAYAFNGCYRLKSVELPNVVSIEFSAFTDTGIVTIDFPNATEIEKCAFQSCKRLESVRLPSVEWIGLYTFSEAGDYSRGVEIYMPNLKTIGDYAFERARLASTVDLPSVITIKEGAFNMARIRVLNIPNVRKIGANAFKDCIFKEINANPSASVVKSAFGKGLSMVSKYSGEPFVLVNDNGTYRAVLKSNSAEYSEKYSKSRRPLHKARGIKEADGDMKTYEIIYTVDGTLSKQKVRAASQSEAESLIKERNKGNVVIQTAKEIRGITEDVDKDVRPSPESGAATGIAGMLIDAINDEWETINRYNSMITTVRSMLEDIDNIEGVTAGDLQDTVEIIENINNEENNHVGMLQSALALYSENVETIKDGEKEAEGIKTDVADGEIIKNEFADDEFADDEFVGRLVKNVKGVIVDA